jgi:ClpP class serine protease
MINYSEILDDLIENKEYYIEKYKELLDSYTKMEKMFNKNLSKDINRSIAFMIAKDISEKKGHPVDDLVEWLEQINYKVYFNE